MTLAAAQKALDAGDDAAALVALVEAWQANRHPRIADLVDRVSARLGGSLGGTVEGKTVKARTAAWSELARKRRIVDIGRLYAVPWPGTWKACLPLVELACALPPDPRTAIALAKLVSDERFDTYTASRFYSRIINQVTRLADVRAIPILQVAVDTPMSTYFRDTKQEVVAAIAHLGLMSPALSAADETRVAALEARFAEAITAERANARGREDFLAAIYANPDDDAARSVFADWLTEEGDPLGEFIALQLAKADPKRQQTLIKKHGKRWAGALDALIGKHLRHFERGFLASVYVDIDVTRDIPEGFHDPAWGTVHTVKFGWSTRQGGGVAKLLALPTFANVRRVRDVDDEDLLAIAPRSNLESADFAFTRASLDRARILDGVAFSNLRELGFDTRVWDDDLLALATAFVQDTPQSRKLQRLVLRDRRDLPLVMELAARLKLPVECAITEDDWLLVWRDGVLRAGPETGDVLPRAYSLAANLDALQPEQLTALHVASVPYDYSIDDLEKLATALARFPKATIDVPWPHVATGASQAPVHCRFELSPVDVTAIWPLVTEIGLAFDGMSVNGGKHTPIDGDVLDLATKTLAKKRTNSVQLYQTARRRTAQLEIYKRHFEVTSAWSDEPGYIDTYLAWLDRVVALGGELSYVAFAKRGPDSQVFGYAGWIKPVDPKWPADKVKRLAKTLPWLRVHELGAQLVLVLGASPTVTTTREQIEELDRAFASLDQ